jgi:hypothetical protein
MGNMTMAFFFVITLNLLIAMSQLSMVHLADNESTNFWNCKGSLLGQYSNDCKQLIDDRDINSQLPQVNTQLNPTTSNFFTDMFASISRWFSSALGVSYVVAIATGPASLVNAMLPSDELLGFRVLINIFWYGLTIFITASFFFWRD